MKTLIEVKNVSKDFKQNTEVIHALKNTNLAVHEGEFVAIIGPSGSGKSTLLTILGGLQEPTTGGVTIDDECFSCKDEKERSKLRFRKIGFILQSSNLIPFLTIKDQLYLHSKVAKEKKNVERAKKLCKDLNIEKLLLKYPNQISGGEKQRAAIVKALYHNPSVILADEPTAALDTKKAFDVVKLLAKETKEEKKATIMVTHDERLIQFCDKVYEIVDGVLSVKETKK